MTRPTWDKRGYRDSWVFTVFDGFFIILLNIFRNSIFQLHGFTLTVKIGQIIRASIFHPIRFVPILTWNLTRPKLVLHLKSTWAQSRVSYRKNLDSGLKINHVTLLNEIICKNIYSLVPTCKTGVNSILDKFHDTFHFKVWP